VLYVVLILQKMSMVQCSHERNKKITQNKTMRPVYPQEEIRSEFFKIRLKPSEVTQLQEMAQAEYLDPSNYVRRLIFAKKLAA